MLNNVTNEFEMAKKSGCEVYCDDVASYYEVHYNEKYVCFYSDMLIGATIEETINMSVIELLDGGGY